MTQTSKPATVYWLENQFYLNITNQCSNNCVFCLRNVKKGVNGFNLKLNREPIADEVIAELEEAASLKRWSNAVFCGFGEPTTRLDCLIEVSKWIKHRFGENFRIRLDTNGQACILNVGRNVIAELKAAGITEVSVSLNGYDAESYAEACRPTHANAYAAVLCFIEQAKKEFAVEVTAVTAPEVDTQKVKAIAEALGVKFRLRAYIPGFY